MAHERALRSKLCTWYDRTHRRLPWRETRDPYRIWVSEIMLQQTRVAAVLPYYESFLERFPSPEALAEASEQEVLARWSGLGYYSRARNLHRAAREVAERGGFPRDYQTIRALPGIGDYTAAAIASIAFELPHAVVDGNVMRVLARLENETGDIRSTVTRRRLTERAGQLLDTSRPGHFNQALMELGAIVCTPRQPGCDACPVSRFCEARKLGTQHQLPVKLGRKPAKFIDKTVLVIERRGRLLLRQRPKESRKLAGFWELPEPDEAPGATSIGERGEFRHSITNHNYLFTVQEARIGRAPNGFCWIPTGRLDKIPLSTTTRKALATRAKRLE